MKRITLPLFILAPLAFFAQDADQKIQQYLNANRDKLGLSAQDVSGWVIDSKGDSDATKIQNYYLKQRVNGIEVFNAISNVWVKNGEVINATEGFIANASQKVNTSNPSLDVLEAFSAARALLSEHNPGPFAVISSEKAHHYKISNGVLADEPASAELVYQQMPDGSLRLAWDLMFHSTNSKHLWSVRIDALNGQMLEQHDLTVSCSFDGNHNHAEVVKSTAFTRGFYKNASALEAQSGAYRVIPHWVESPSHGPRQLLTAPHDPVASPHGWHDTNNQPGAEFTITRGNNVQAMEDHDGLNGTGTSPNGGPTLNFDFPYGGVTVAADTYVNASVTNLFYMVNIMHDVWFRYGFNEQNGNFQQMNYSGFVQPGFGGDAVIADAQDGNGVAPNINNANFSTPPDGQRPRVQMYLWNVLPSPLQILEPADIAGGIPMANNVFEPGNVPIPLEPALIQTNLVLYNDGVGDTADACSPAINPAELSGNVAILRRGDCTFVEKVLFAQQAGAVAAIVVNNVADPAYVGMSGADANITIPAVLVSLADGNELIARLATGPVTVKLQRTNFVHADGDFDNGIIAHEVGHGISSRLTGGAANVNCLFNNEAMGEGWSDWFALMTTMSENVTENTARGIASFALSQSPSGSGLRQYPYTTDMSINPLTLANSNSSGETYRYDVGEVWATMLWDLTWAYINKYGYDPNIYTGTGGNNKVMQLVIDALKLQPCSPGFVAARNAIIAADQATTGGEDFCMIWDVFARRGLGVNASSGSTSNSNDQIEDFSTPPPGPNCSLSVNHIGQDLIRVYPNPSNGLYNVRLNAFAGKASVALTDINGRMVYNAIHEFDTETSLDVRHLQSGLYILKISGNNVSYTQKLIKN